MLCEKPTPASPLDAEADTAFVKARTQDVANVFVPCIKCLLLLHTVRSASTLCGMSQDKCRRCSLCLLMALLAPSTETLSAAKHDSK